MKKRNLLIVLLSMAFVGASAVAMSACEKDKPTLGIKYEISQDGTYAEVIGYKGTENEIRIADTYNSLPVKIINDDAFLECLDLTSVEIPNSVIKIGESAFQSCRSLTSIEIPDSVTTIGSFAFSQCSSLTSVKMGDSVTTIGDLVFSQCSS
ncbi:MAG: leucine-rich repeat domain-containing protein, partial [Clostridia bacterium]|nr:leucine-rich repeat domain-containing protein [Clostridia bacterium]